MRVLLSVHHPLNRNAGAQGATLALGDSLCELGCKVEFLSFDRVFPAHRYTAAEPLRYPWSVASRLARIAKDFNVIDASSGDAWLWATLARPGATKQLALITRSHGLEHAVDRLLRDSARRGASRLRRRYRLYHGGFRLWEVRRSFQLADMSIFVNDEDAAFAVESFHLDERRVRVIANGIAPSFLRVADVLDGLAGPVRLAFVGGWTERKGNAALVEAVDSLVRDGIDFQLLLAGTGLGPEKLLPCFSAAARPRIEVRPQYENSALPALLADREIVLFLSRAEGFGLTLIEAMACGLAPVATPVGVAPAAIRPEENGYFVQVDAGAQVAAAIKELSSDRERLLRLRRAAQRSAREYDWSRVGRATLLAYRDALASKLR